MLTRFMVIMNEVEKAVNQEPFQFIVKTKIIFSSLSLGFVEIDDNVSKDKVVRFKF